MAGKTLPKILYWIDGRIPTPDHIRKAESLNGVVVFRNAAHVPEDGSLEEFDDLAGDVPERYATELKRRRQKSSTAPVRQPTPEQLAGPNAASGTNQEAPQQSAWQTGAAPQPKGKTK